MRLGVVPGTVAGHTVEVWMVPAGVELSAMLQGEPVFSQVIALQDCSATVDALQLLAQLIEAGGPA